MIDAQPTSPRLRRRLTLSPILLMITLLLAAGCASPPAPRPRTGSLPFPGLFTLYALADVDSLDDHSYGLPSPFKSGSKGIVYTERAGFVDLAHVRWTIDWGWYYQQRIHAALTAGETELIMPTNKPSHVHLQLHYPEDWDRMRPEERDSLIDEIALRLAQETAWVIGIWHEMATYFGYASWVVIPEDQSAFTHEDTFSHLVGLYVLERALRRGGSDLDQVRFNKTVTVALGEVLSALGPYDVDGTHEAVLAVEGRWWRDAKPVRRYLDLGLEGGPLRPWLIPAEPGAPGSYGSSWHVPGMHDFKEPALRHFATIGIQPHIWQAGAIREAAGTEDNLIRPDDFPRIMERIRADLYELHGREADRP